MPETPQLGTYISYKDLTGQPATLNQLKSFLSQHKKSEVLVLCAVLNAALETWTGKIRHEVDQQLVDLAFLPEHAHKIKEMIKASEPTRVVFHRAQALFIAKQALLHSQEDDQNVIDRFRDPYWLGLGAAFLMANDLLHFNFAYREKTVPEQLLIRMIHSIPLLESWGRNSFLSIIGRSWLMLKRFGPARTSGSFVDIEAAFQNACGLSTEQYLALCCGMMSHYLDLSFEQITAMSNGIALSREWFTGAGVDLEIVNKFLDDVSASPAMMRDKFLSRDCGPSDITWFRDKPVSKVKDNVLIVLDTKSLTEKLNSGIFWRVHNSLSTNGAKQQLHNHWGIAFENYMHWLLEQACKNGPNRFYASPKYGGTSDEVCDAIILCGVDAVFLEFKGSTFTAQAKYKGDAMSLASEIDDNLVGVPSRRKGIRQLAHAILSLFNKRSQQPIDGIDLSKINTIFPVLVTRDDVGGCWGISNYLQRQIDGFFNRRDVRPKRVAPLFCLSCEEAEWISAYLDQEPLPRLLNGWYKNDPGRYWSFKTISNPVIDLHGFKKNGNLDAASQKVFEDAIRVLFPNATSDNPQQPGN